MLSLLENGRREPKLSLIEALASALAVPADELMRQQAPSRRAQLEIALAEAQRDPVYASLGLPYLRVGARVPSDVLEHMLALYAELRRQRAKPTATPEEARAANADLRAMMRERGNYFAEIEQAAAEGAGAGRLLGRRAVPGHAAVGRSATTASPSGTSRTCRGPRGRSPTCGTGGSTSSRSRSACTRRARSCCRPSATSCSATARPQDFADFLRQRVEANYFAAAVLVPEQAAVAFLRHAKENRDLSVEDLRDVFSVSYEMAAHRFTNLATHHLGLTCHFVKNDAGGIIYKAYENDGVVFPADAAGAIEGQRMCRHWSGRQVFAAADRFSPHYQYSDTPSGTYWCVARRSIRAASAASRSPSASRSSDARWFRGRETTKRTRSACPDPACCQRPPARLAARWDGMAWPSARAHSHILSALPSGSFPGVDEATSTRSSSGTSAD